MNSRSRAGQILAGWAFSSDDLASALIGDRMINPSIDLANPCNLNCPYCFIEEKNSTRKKRKPGELSKEETLDIIGDFISAGALTINIVGAGEPTIDPAFKDVVDYIHQAGVRTVVFTNGARFAKDPLLAKFLFERDVTVVLKLNSLNAGLQDDLVGKKGYSQIQQRALKSLVETGFSANEPTRLALDTIAVEGNLAEIPRIHRFARENNIFPLIADFIPTGRTAGGKFVGEAALKSISPAGRDKLRRILQPLTHRQRKDLVSSLREIDRHDFGLKDSAQPGAYYSGQKCTQLLGLYVDIQGLIWPCVARARSINGELRLGLLGSTRAGDRPSVIWRQNGYMRRIRLSYTGACPYKPALEIQEMEEATSSDTLVKIGAWKGGYLA